MCLAQGPQRSDAVHEDTFLKKIRRVIPFTLYINSSIQIKFSFVSAYPTDPEKKALLKTNYFNFQSRFVFLIPLQT